MNPSHLQQAATILHQGGIVAFHTETYYGLAVDPFNEEALARLYSLKQRPGSKPLLTLIPKLTDIFSLVTEIPACLQPLVKLWPAPLTLVCPALASLSPLLTAGTGTVGVRISPHPGAQALLACYGQAMTATSANLAGQSPACTPAQVAEQFPAGLDFILAGGITPGGQGSTLVGCQDGQTVLIRAGVLPLSSLTIIPNK